MKPINIVAVIMLTLASLIGLIPTVAFAEDKLFNENQNKMENNIYLDVSENDWFYYSVQTVSEANLMRGIGQSRFAPEADITLAEVYTIAARIHAIYYTGSAEAADGYENNADKPWFYRYVKYCMDNGIMIGEPGDVTQPAFRIECASLLSRSLPEKELTEINAVADNAIPDLPLTQDTENVYRLYRAGVLTGKDEAGNFCPESKVRRSEVAAIVARLIDHSLRRSVAGLTHTAEDMNTSLTAEEAAELLHVALTEAYENIYGTFVPLDSKPEEYVPDAEYLRWVISHLEVADVTKDGYTFPVIFPFFVDRYSGMICKVYNGLNHIMTEFDPLSSSALSFAG